MRNRRAAAIHRPFDVHRQCSVDDGVANLVEDAGDVHPGVVDEHIDPAVVSDTARDEGLDLLWLAHVGGDRRGDAPSVANTLGSVRGRLAVQIDAEETTTLLRQSLGYRFADA